MIALEADGQMVCWITRWVRGHNYFSLKPLNIIYDFGFKLMQHDMCLIVYSKFKVDSISPRVINGVMISREHENESV